MSSDLVYDLFKSLDTETLEDIARTGLPDLEDEDIKPKEIINEFIREAEYVGVKELASMMKPVELKTICENYLQLQFPKGTNSNNKMFLSKRFAESFENTELSAWFKKCDKKDVLVTIGDVLSIETKGKKLDELREEAVTGIYSIGVEIILHRLSVSQLRQCCEDMELAGAETSSSKGTLVDAILNQTDVEKKASKSSTKLITTDKKAIGSCKTLDELDEHYSVKKLNEFAKKNKITTGSTKKVTMKAILEFNKSKKSNKENVQEKNKSATNKKATTKSKKGETESADEEGDADEESTKKATTTKKTTNTKKSKSEDEPEGDDEEEAKDDKKSTKKNPPAKKNASAKNTKGGNTKKSKNAEPEEEEEAKEELETEKSSKKTTTKAASSKSAKSKAKETEEEADEEEEEEAKEEPAAKKSTKKTNSKKAAEPEKEAEDDPKADDSEEAQKPAKKSTKKDTKVEEESKTEAEPEETSEAQEEAKDDKPEDADVQTKGDAKEDASEDASEAESGKPLAGKLVCISGEFKAPKSELSALAKSAGAEIATSLTKKVFLVILGEGKNAAKVREIASKHGIPIEDEDYLTKICKR